MESAAIKGILTDMGREFASFAGELEAVKGELARLGRQQFKITTLLEEQNDIWEEALDELRRTARERDEAARSQVEKECLTAAVKEFLPMMDALGEALRLLEQSSRNQPLLEAWVSGIRDIHLRGERALEALGVKRIETVGRKFDPYLHRAVEIVPVGDKGLADVVLLEISPGYVCEGRVIRYAEVGVGRFETRAERGVIPDEEPYYRDRPWDDQFGCGDP